MVHRPVLRVHCILEVPEPRQAFLHEEVEQLEALLPGDRPQEMSGIHRANRLDPAIAQHGLQRCQIPVKHQGLNRPMSLGQLLAVGGVIIPFTSSRLRSIHAGLHEDVVGLAHPTVERLHQVGLLALELLGQIATLGQEVMGVHGLCPIAKLGRQLLQLIIEPPLIRKLIFKLFTPLTGHDHADIGLQTLRVGRIVEREVNDRMTLGLTRLGKRPHRREESKHLLDVVGCIIGLLPHLRHEVHHVLRYSVEPGVGCIELIPEKEAKGLHVALTLEVRRQRPLQYFTSSQHRAHFFLQSKGRPQWTHSLDGRWGYLCMWKQHRPHPPVHRLGRTSQLKPTAV